MSKPYILRPTRIYVLPEGEPLFSEKATIVEIIDESGGDDFIQIHQIPDVGEDNVLRINSEDEWNAIAAAVADMFSEIAKWNKEKQP